MSMRAAFTTSFIYDSSNGWHERYVRLCEIFGAKPERRNIIGQIAGVISGSDLSETDIKRWIDDDCFEASKVTLANFDVVYLLESGDIIIKKVIAFWGQV